MYFAVRTIFSLNDKCTQNDALPFLEKKIDLKVKDI